MDASGSLSSWDGQHTRGENLCGCVWLPSYIKKIRAQKTETDSRDELLLEFLKMNASDVERIVRSNSQDGAAARAILVASGRSPEETVRWSSHFLAKFRDLARS